MFEAFTMFFDIVLVGCTIVSSNLLWFYSALQLLSLVLPLLFAGISHGFTGFYHGVTRICDAYNGIHHGLNKFCHSYSIVLIWFTMVLLRFTIILLPFRIVLHVQQW